MPEAAAAILVKGADAARQRGPPSWQRVLLRVSGVAFPRFGRGCRAPGGWSGVAGEDGALGQLLALRRPGRASSRAAILAKGKTLSAPERSGHPNLGQGDLHEGAGPPGRLPSSESARDGFSLLSTWCQPAEEGPCLGAHRGQQVNTCPERYVAFSPPSPTFHLPRAGTRCLPWAGFPNHQQGHEGESQDPNAQ